MTVKEIIINYLKKNGYDGLCGDSCGCGLNDFQPCDEDFGNCEPAYYHPHPDCSKCDVKCDICYSDYACCYKTDKPEGKQYGLQKHKTDIN